MAIQDEIPRVVKSDPVRLKQIVSNLVGNAIKFSGTGSKVDVIFSFRNEELVVDVIDQGIGISEEAQQRIFEAFRQADPHHSRQFGGAGLGLSISKKLAQVLGGDVVLVDSQINVGSHFRLRLPIKQQKVSSERQFTLQPVPSKGPEAPPWTKWTCLRKSSSPKIPRKPDLVQNIY